VPYLQLLPVPSWRAQELYTKDVDVEEEMESFKMTLHTRRFNDRVVKTLLFIVHSFGVIQFAVQIMDIPMLLFWYSRR
jgi:hypothetical protein